jgi:biopolymer transport protein ExbB
VFCVVRINQKKMLPAALQLGLAKALAEQDVPAAIRLCESDGSSLSHVIRETLIKAGAGVSVYSKADLEAAASETIFHEETKFMLWVNMLNAFAAVAPMIGLLGTVSGMIQSFEKLSSGAGKASDFAGGIGEAMVATAAGLLVAIPSMFAYFLFKNLLQSLIARLSHATSTLINRFVTGPAAEVEA